ncbi:adenylate/guanylate cyclase domain-containing protein [Venatoribacter cucullus]|uniref:adenylate/guanylate cyclase domain-containing protein n=1 Tax=Venatoribacter cucullus TaxID=2661630 RepID=UPI00223F7A34|nr:adenylate/guanylate cyclase domain-containing protein [Venatoribacter cucullus]UZK03751.1 adenylate cyclase [Venatoribacter cucullus]
MSRPHDPSHFTETTLPRQDYMARGLGYGVAAVTVMVGYLLEYFDQRVFAVALVSLLYPHLVFILSRPFEKKKRATRKFLINIDAFLFGIFLGFLHLPMEIAGLFLIMINTSFIVVGSITAWVFCVISLAAGVSTGILIFGFHTAPAAPPALFMTAAFGVGMHLAVTAFNSNRQARDLIRLKQKFQGQVERFQALSQQVSKYVAPQVWESIFSGRRQARLETQRKKLVVFFSDIVGFSSLSEQIEAEAFTDLLNQYLTDMSRIALKYGGTIDKFIGDGIMIFFGDPVSKGTKRDALACVSMAIEMRRHMLKLRKQWAEHGMTAPLQIRMGINTGYCTVGNFGTDSRMDYTIIGKEVNLASRLESEADAGEILISHETFALVKDKIICRQRGTAMVKGFRDPVPLYQVVDYRRDLGSNPSFVNHETEGFSLYLESEKIREEEKERVADALEKAANKLRGKVADVSR